MLPFTPRKMGLIGRRRSEKYFGGVFLLSFCNLQLLYKILSSELICTRKDAQSSYSTLPDNNR